MLAASCLLLASARALAQPAPSPAETAVDEPPAADSPSTQVLSDAPQGADDAARLEQARQWFAAGVSLARAGRYEAAKAMFAEAYRARPHHLVLYNIAQAELELRQLPAAASSLRRYLDEGGAAIPEAQREAVEAEIARIEADAARVASEGAPHASVASPPVAPSPAADGAPPGAPSTLLAAETSETLPAPAPAPPPAADAADQTRLWAYVSASAGAALLVGSLTLFLWNDARYDDWRSENAALEQIAGQLARREPVAEDPDELRERATTNNDLLRSIERVDVLTAIAAGVGAVGAAAGVYLYVRAERAERAPVGLAPSWRILAHPSSLELRGGWTF